MDLLIAGGDADYNLHALAQAAKNQQQAYHTYYIQAKTSPNFHWDVNQSNLPEGLGLLDKPQAAFVRQDVFAFLEDNRDAVYQRANAWYVGLKGWLLSQPDIFIFNRSIDQMASYKPAALSIAQQIGLTIPRSFISSNTSFLQNLDAQHYIAKPINGGGHCVILADAIQGISHAFMPSPAIVQSKLVSPEFRIFVIGTEAFTFRLESPSLDYREKQDAVLTVVDSPEHELSLLKELMIRFRMNFGAADFKTDPETGKLIFLELNTSPMFAAFNDVSEGKLCEAMTRQLLLGEAVS